MRSRKGFKMLLFNSSKSLSQAVAFFLLQHAQPHWIFAAQLNEVAILVGVSHHRQDTGTKLPPSLQPRLRHRLGLVESLPESADGSLVEEEICEVSGLRRSILATIQTEAPASCTAAAYGSRTTPVFGTYVLLPLSVYRIFG